MKIKNIIGLMLALAMLILIVPTELFAVDAGYSVTVIDGSAKKGGKYIYNANYLELVTIEADVPEGQEFDKWIVEQGNVILSSKTARVTGFTMPAEDVVIRATFKGQTSSQMYDITIENGTAKMNGKQIGPALKSVPIRVRPL